MAKEDHYHTHDDGTVGIDAVHSGSPAECAGATASNTVHDCAAADDDSKSDVDAAAADDDAHSHDHTNADDYADAYDHATNSHNHATDAHNHAGPDHQPGPEARAAAVSGKNWPTTAGSTNAGQPKARPKSRENGHTDRSADY